MEAKHTPLPWVESGEYPFGIEREVPGMADGYDGYMVADTITHSLIRKEEALANRQLILHAVNNIDRITAERDAALAEAERLRAGIRNYLDGNTGHKFESKYDQCPHERFGWEDCGNCIDAHFTRLIGETSSLPDADKNGVA